MNLQSAISCRLLEAAERWPQRPALIEPNGTLNFAALNEQVSQRALDLQAQGLGAEDWTLLRIRNSAAGIVDWLAVLRAGARVIPVAEQLPDQAVQALLAEHAIPALISEPGAELEHTCFATTRTAAVGLRRQFEARQPCAGVATSGSTGTPRIAVHSYANYVRSAQGAIEYLPLKEDDRYLLSLPLFHVGGLGILFRCLEAGVPMVLGGRSEDADFLNDYQISHVSMVETQLRRLLHSSAAPLPHLRWVLLGGGPVAAELVQEAQERGLTCYMSYGLTEMSALVAAWPAASGGGRVLRYRELRTENDEICVRGQTLCLGYLKAGRIAPLEIIDGWFPTGDLGRWEDGRLLIQGRRDNQFISGGENIQPEAIESTLRNHTMVLEAVVVPRRDKEFGQRPVAFLRTAGQPDYTELRQWLRTRLSPHLTPVAWHPLPEPQGLKLRRQELIRLAEELREAN